MKKIALSTLFSAVTLMAAPAAFAQNCPPGSWLCAEVNINTGTTQQPVIVQPPPPPPQVLVVRTPPPPPQVVYVPAPAPPPPRLIVTTTPTYTLQTETTYEWVGMRQRPSLGVGANVAGLLLPGHDRSSRERSGAMGGVNGVIRYRANPYFATELTLGYFGGHDYNGDLRQEVPLTLNGLVYLNPMHRFQFYVLGGLGFSAARVDYQDSNMAAHGGRTSGNYGYFGGQLGVGAEWQLSQHFALFADVRGFVRTRIDDELEVNPEFQRVDSGRIETTNTSIGGVFQLGGMLYF